MKEIVRSAHFRCTEGTSDKVYSVAIIKDERGYSVITAYGPTGGHVTHDDKTKTPVTIEQAQKEYDSVVKSRLKKLYVDTAVVNDAVFERAA